MSTNRINLHEPPKRKIRRQHDSFGRSPAHYVKFNSVIVAFKAVMFHLTLLNMLAINGSRLRFANPFMLLMVNHRAEENLQTSFDRNNSHKHLDMSFACDHFGNGVSPLWLNAFLTYWMASCDGKFPFATGRYVKRLKQRTGRNKLNGMVTWSEIDECIRVVLLNPPFSEHSSIETWSVLETYNPLAKRNQMNHLGSSCMEVLSPNVKGYECISRIRCEFVAAKTSATWKVSYHLILVLWNEHKLMCISAEIYYSVLSLSSWEPQPKLGP